MTADELKPGKTDRGNVIAPREPASDDAVRDIPRFAWEFFPPVAAIVLLAILAVFSLRMIRLSEQENQRSNHALAFVQQIVRDLLNAETGQRGYLLSGNAEYLEPYHQARGSYSQHVAKADDLTLDADSLATLDQVFGIADTQFETWAQSIQSLGAGDRDEALRWMVSGQSKQNMDVIRQSIAEIEMRIRDRIDQTAAESATAYFNSIITFGTALVMTLAATVWSFWKVDRELQRRHLGEQTIRLRTGQLQLFADVVARVFAARDVESIIDVALNEFRQLLGAREAMLALSLGRDVRYDRGVVASGVHEPSPEYLAGVFELVEKIGSGEATFIRTRAQVLASEQATNSPLWKLCGDAFDGVLSSPLRDSARHQIGRLVLLGKFGGDFTDHDALLVSQLAYSVSVAIENAQLTAAMEQEANRKDEFLAMLGHELRNPLASVLTGAEALAQIESARSGDDSSHPFSFEARALSDSILRQSRMMSRIVDDLLDVSRIARGKITLAISSADLVAIIDQTVEDYRMTHSSREFRVEIVPRPEGYVISGDPTRLTQCLSNLLHNACKFSAESSPITIKLQPYGRSALGAFTSAMIQVIDAGVGMTPEEQKVVCDLFTQTQTTIDRGEGGLGIGLTLVKGLVEMHGGQLLVASPGRGHGSVFTIRLPLARPVTRPKQSAHYAPSVAPRVNTTWIDAGQEPQPLNPVSHIGLAPASADQTTAKADPVCVSQKILVIDDRVDAILPIRVILKRDGHEVFEAHDGVAGVELARRVKPDVVLCDIGLPGKLNGYDVVKELRYHESTRNALIVALSGYSQPSDRQRAREAGFDGHLAKPIDATRLRALVRRDVGYLGQYDDVAVASVADPDPTT
jgi:signal transduction histidine kinase/CHASE3 domain sensor protein/ActR/RegA family two-component response regulator